MKAKKGKLKKKKCEEDGGNCTDPNPTWGKEKPCII